MAASRDGAKKACSLGQAARHDAHMKAPWGCPSFRLDPGYTEVFGSKSMVRNNIPSYAPNRLRFFRFFPERQVVYHEPEKLTGRHESGLFTPAVFITCLCLRLNSLFIVPRSARLDRFFVI